MSEYNCEPLNIERLRQSARMTRQNQLDGLPDSAWQVGIQEWAADRLAKLEDGIRALADVCDVYDTDDVQIHPQWVTKRLRAILGEDGE